MPKRTDIKKIMIIGSGPIIIGQACEFDYSGTQAVKVLREDGYQVVLVNSNPATIMTDPDFADATYIEPITPEIVAKIIEKERPDALLPTLGGQTGLNVAVALAESGVLKKFGVELIGAKLPAIKKAEDRSLFKKAMQKIGVAVPESSFAYSMEEAAAIADKIGFPIVVRPSFTLGGTGGGIAANRKDFNEMVRMGLFLSPVGELLLERSVFGWKEYELEVMKDCADNVVIICSIENFDPMGVHTGDSITVAPAQTLTDHEYQKMREAAIKIIREIGVETGGSNIQFAIHPDNGELIVIEMNPRVSRSSALASKATGFPIAKIAAKLAVGYTLDEISNDITKETPASFEPTIDYVVVKIPRFAFEKFPETDATLTIKMKSVGEAMAIGRTFKEAFNKAIRSLEIDRFSLYDGNDDLLDNKPLPQATRKAIIHKLKVPNEERPFYIRKAFIAGFSIDQIAKLTNIDRWFLSQLKEITDLELAISRFTLKKLPSSLLRLAKEFGFSDREIARLTGSVENTVREKRKKEKITPVFKMVDTCAAEFEAYTPYYYSTYEEETEVLPTTKKKVLILGSGPNRIGQGIEFDYCCVHASFALEELGYESIMLNSNPETVSTDYDTSDRLYFEPLTYEDVMNVIEAEKPIGVILQFGGQTPLKIAKKLQAAGVKIIGTSFDSIDLAEDRKRFSAIANKLNIKLPENGTARSFKEALSVARDIGYPMLVRPSYVLGGRAMEIVYSDKMLESYIINATKASPEHPILLDKFLEGAVEVDVDAISDGRDVYIGGIMEHVEEAGIHSGDSACAIPPFSLAESQLKVIRLMTIKLAKALKVKGLINIQFAIKDEEIYCLEVNPRASRTVPFVSKATGIPLAKIATKVVMGARLKDLKLSENIETPYFSVKEAVLPFGRFPEVDLVLGPEMKSTGEVMGIGLNFGEAFAKSQMATYFEIPETGSKVFISVSNRDKRAFTSLAKRLTALGYELVSTMGTAQVLHRHGIPCDEVFKLSEGKPNVVDLIREREIKMVINTPWGRSSRSDGYEIRTAAAQNMIPCITTLQAADAFIHGIENVVGTDINVCSLQEYYELSKKSRNMVKPQRGKPMAQAKTKRAARSSSTAKKTSSAKRSTSAKKISSSIRSTAAIKTSTGIK